MTVPTVRRCSRVVYMCLVTRIRLIYVFVSVSRCTFPQSLTELQCTSAACLTVLKYAVIVRVNRRHVCQYVQRCVHVVVFMGVSVQECRYVCG